MISRSKNLKESGQPLLRPRSNPSEAKMIKVWSFKTSLVIPMLLILAATAFSQGGTSRVSGSVTDSNGAVLEGAKVTVTNEATGVAVTQVTTSGGLFSFASIPPGNYTIEVEQSGFKKVIRKATKVEVDTPLAVKIAMEIGDVTESVTVQADAIEVQSNTAVIGNVVDQRTIETLPLNGRNPLALVLQEPGVVQRSFGGAGSGVHINGSRDRAYNVTIDGIDANESSVPNPISNLYRLNPDNVQEFKVTTNNATAEEGRNSGASIGLSTKSGTNQFHGTLFYYNRNDAFNSAEWFANALNLPKRDTKLHQFGVEVGGPIIKNKTFFFGSWQQNRVDFTQPIDQTFGVPIVYTASAKAGLFRYWVPDPANPLILPGQTTGAIRNSPLMVDPFTGALRTDLGIVPCATPTSVRCVRTYSIGTSLPAGVVLDSSVASYFATLPTPNAFGFGDGLNTAAFLWNPPTAVRGPAISARVDHTFNGNNSIFGRYLFSDYNTLKGDPLNGRPQVFPGFPAQGEVYRRTSNFVTGWRRNISPYITNDFRFGYSRFNFLFTQGETNPAFPDVPSVDFSSITEPYLNTARTQRDVFTPQFIDNLSIVHGNHVIGIGANVRLYRHEDRRSLGGPTISLAATGTPSRAALGFAAAPGINSTDNNLLQNAINNLIGQVTRIQQVFVADFANDVFLPYLNDGDTPTNLFTGRTKANQINLYAQDEWKVRNNLTINFGARWEINPAASTDGQTFVPNRNVFDGPVTFVEADSWYKISNWKYIGPSLGIVWGPESKNGFIRSIFGEPGQSAIRLGYRIAFDPISTFQVTSAASRIPGLTQLCSSTIVNPPAGSPAGTLPTTTTTAGCTAAPVNQTLGQGFPQFLAPPTLRPSTFLTPNQQTLANSPGITLFAPEMKMPSVHQWSLSIQREFPWQMVMQAAYVGRRGTHLYYAGNRNQTNPDAIMASYLLMQENMRRGCVPAGVPSAPGGSIILTGAAACTNPITNIPLLATGTGITPSIVNATAAINEISPGLTFLNNGVTTTYVAANALGAFADRVENNSLFFRLRPNQQFNVITFIDNAGDSTYHAFQFTLRRRFAQGFGMGLTYTWGRSMDNQSVDPIGAASGGGLSTTNSRTPTDMRRLNEEWARSDFDRTHVFNLTTVWELPFGKGRRFGSDMPGWLNQIVGGWAVNSISTFMTGEPFSVRSGFRTSNGGHESRADVIDPSVRARLQFVNGITGPVVFADNDAFAVPAPGSNGAGRNIFVAPSYYNLDIGIIKQFSITERVKLDFRTEMFNALNRVNFDNPRDASVGSPSIQSSLFGQTCCQGVAPPGTQTIIQTGESARVIQFALKLKF